MSKTEPRAGTTDREAEKHAYTVCKATIKQAMQTTPQEEAEATAAAAARQQNLHSHRHLNIRWGAVQHRQRR